MLRLRVWARALTDRVETVGLGSAGGCYGINFKRLVQRLHDENKVLEGTLSDDYMWKIKGP